VNDLSEVKNRFRVKSGEQEIEYEGPLSEVNKRYEKAFEWMKSQPTKGNGSKKKTPKQSEKEDKRGGVRKAIYPPTIKKLKEEKWFKPKKSLDDVIKKFESVGLPTKGKKRNAILTALRADTRKKNSVLKGTKEDDTWYFLQD
jgi:hypothetical protein